MDLLTLSAIAEKLDLPESTVRYHVKKFSRFIPAIGEGRQRRYRPEAVEVLRMIAEMLKRNQTATEVAEALGRQFPLNIESEEQGKITATTKQQQTTTKQQQLDLAENFKEFWNLHLEMVKQSVEKDKLLIEQSAKLDTKEKELSEAMTTITKARNELQRLLQVQQDAEAKGKALLEKKAALEARERELEALRAENERLRLPFWRRWFRK
jgi:DNA-binding transcriptional MerR regulator